MEYIYLGYMDYWSAVRECNRKGLRLLTTQELIEAFNANLLTDILKNGNIFWSSEKDDERYFFGIDFDTKPIRAAFLNTLQLHVVAVKI